MRGQHSWVTPRYEEFNPVTWSTIINKIWLLPEPNEKEVARMMKLKCALHYKILGIFDSYRRCLKVLDDADDKHKDAVARMSIYSSERRNAFSFALSQAKAKNDVERVTNLHRMCVICQAEDMLEIHKNLLLTIVGAVPEPFENFCDYMKRCHTLGLFKYTGVKKGWRRYVNRIH